MKSLKNYSELTAKDKEKLKEHPLWKLNLDLGAEDTDTELEYFYLRLGDVND